MELGKLQRMKHIRRNSNRKLLIVPMDHGISMGPIKGITCMSDCIHQLSEFPINAMIMQKGMIAACSDVIGKSDIPVMHCAGYPCRMDKIREICDKYHLYLVQDCAHALYSRYGSKHVAAYGDLSIFSFEASKNLNAGEGGFIAMDDTALFEKAYSIHSCGRPVGGEWRSHINICENYRPTEFQGAIALAQLNRIANQQERRERSIQYLDSELVKSRYFEAIPLEGDAVKHGAYSYVIRIKEEGRKKLTGKRLAIYLESEGIKCNSGYLSLIYDIDYAKQFSTEQEREQYKEQCPNAVSFVKYTIWLPQTILISPLKDIDDVVGALNKISRCVFGEE